MGEDLVANKYKKELLDLLKRATQEGVQIIISKHMFNDTIAIGFLEPYDGSVKYANTGKKL